LLFDQNSQKYELFNVRAKNAIEVLKNENYSQKAILERKEKHKSVVSREFRRNGSYRAGLAQCH
jgi:IS30 family transposase